MKKNDAFICNGFDKKRMKNFFRFVIFINEKGVFTAFKYNVRNNINPNSFINNHCNGNIRVFFLIAAASEWINYSMHWAATPQGQEFWANLDSKWKGELFGHKKYEI